MLAPPVKPCHGNDVEPTLGEDVKVLKVRQRAAREHLDLAGDPVLDRDNPAEIDDRPAVGPERAKFHVILLLEMGGLRRPPELALDFEDDPTEIIFDDDREGPIFADRVMAGLGVGR